MSINFPVVTTIGQTTTLNGKTWVAVSISPDAWALQTISADPSGAGGPFRLQTYLKTAVPNVSTYQWCLIIVTDLTGGAEPCFSDGTNWRRCSDRSIIS